MHDSPISKFNRRDFLLALSALGLAGCGGDGVETLLPGTSNGSNPTGSSVAPVVTGTGGGIPITGTVNRAELGQAVVLSTIQRVGATPGAQGEFETLVGGSFPQLLFANESGGITNSNLRGLSIYLPNQSLQVDANSTALALVFLTLGVMTPDPVEAAGRLNTIRNLPSFAPLLALLRQGLPTQGLSALLADPQLDTLRNAVVDEFLAGLQVNARQLAISEYERQGGMSIEAAEGSTGRDHKFNFENYGFRFTGVVREEVDDEGKETRPAVVANLVGAARLPMPSFARNTGVMGGANSLSWGTFFANSVRDPGGAVDSFTSTARTTKIRYWIRGLGGGGVPSDLPSGVRAVDLGQSDAVNTQFFYVILPLLDVVSGGGAGLAISRLLRKGAPLATDEVKGLGLILGNLAADRSTQNSLIALSSGMSGDPITDSKAFRALMIDMGLLVGGFLAATAPQAIAAGIVAAAGSIAGIVGVTLAAATTVVLGEWVAAGLALVATALALTGGRAAVYNLTRFYADLQRLPYWTKIELPLSTIHFLDHNIARDEGPYKQFLNLTTGGGLAYSWRPSADSLDRRISRLKFPQPGLAYPPEVTYDLSQQVSLIDGNASGEFASQLDENFPDQSTTSTFSIYGLPASGFSNPVQIGQVSWSRPFNVRTANEPANPAPDASFFTEVINSRGDVAGTYDQFAGWFRWDVMEFRPSYFPQVWWIPKGGSLIKKDINQALRAAVVAAYPVAGYNDRPDGRGDSAALKILGLNAFGELLFAARFFGLENGTRSFTEHVSASFNMLTGRIILLSRYVSPGSESGFRVIAGKINDKGQVALTLSETGIPSFGQFYNGIAEKGEPIPTAIGFKNHFYVNDLNNNGEVAGFEQILDTPGVTGKAAIWKPAGSGEVVDVHAQLAGGTITDPYSSSIARLGEDGTIVGTVITKRLTNPDLPAAPDNPEVDLVRDFVINRG